MVSQHVGTGSFNSDFRFNAKEFDEETGNYYYGARYYQPKSSIWMGVDALATSYPGMNPYNFVMGNPIMAMDPDGDSVQVLGFRDNQFLNWLDKGLDINRKNSPFYLENGKLLYDQGKFNDLDDNQKEIAINIIETIKHEKIKITIQKGKSSKVLDERNSKPLTLYDVGGFATIGMKGNENVTIWSDGSNYGRKEKPPILGISNDPISSPNWLSLYHELGGHAYLRYILQDPKQAAHTIEYENLIRSLKGMPLRAYDDEHQ